MSHRHSCDRCRQQKVRCLRDESQRASSGSNSLARCERCAKASVDCVYSLRQRSSRSSVQTSAQASAPRDNNSEPNGPVGTSWFAQGLGGVFCPTGLGSGPDFTDLTGQFPGISDPGPVANFGGWDANLRQPSPFSTSNSSTTPSAVDTIGGSQDVRAISTAPSTADDENPVDTLSYQLTALSQRATQAMRRLASRGGASPTVTSPEVNEAFEDANTLIQIINRITTAPSDSENNDIALAKMDHGLVFLALASHQHLLALFRAICDAVHQCLESMASGNRQKQQQRRSLNDNNVGPSSVAQFVMVLQLLLHLINRMDRCLQVDRSAGYGPESSSGGQITPITPNTRPPQSDTGVNRKDLEGPVSETGLSSLAHGIVNSIPDEHEKLRHVIQELQAKIEHSELH
ncbi:hypothetical protein BGZ63DRAFT_382838 [Mariannaea sp. PMI_226]|nr:hypothetical protein BGZ63DRAFT_382838 [Mariannaea sp. PMI_226]